VTDVYYTVTANLTAANEGPFTLTAKYTEEEAGAITLGEIAQDLVNDFTDFEGKAYNNETKLSNLMEAAIVSKAADRGPKQFGDYVVTTTKDGMIHVDGIDLAAKLQAEDDFYKQEMAAIRTLCKLDELNDGVWNAFVDAFCLGNLFEPQGSDLKLLTTDGYVGVFKTAVKALTDLQNQIGDKAAYLEFLEAYEGAIGTSPLDVAFGTVGGSYEILGQAFDSPKDLAPANENIATIFEGGNADVLIDLMDKEDYNSPYTLFSAKENITSAEDVVNIVNDRISRDWSGRDDIQSVLEALQTAYKGALAVEITVEKTA